MMSDLDYRPDPDDVEEDLAFEQAVRALRRRRMVAATAVLGALGTLLVVPWSESVDVSGRVAPARWARVRSEVPGTVREVKRSAGDTVHEGDVIALLDSDEQRDALEAAQLTLGRERRKLADLELRLTQNRILLAGAVAAYDEATQRARIEEERLAGLEPAASAVIQGVRAFMLEARGEVAMPRPVGPAAPLRGEDTRRAVRAAMADYVTRAEAVAAHVSEVLGGEVGRELLHELESVRFAFALADRSMQEILSNRAGAAGGLIAPTQGPGAPADTRELVGQMEKESTTLSRSLRGFASATRKAIGSPAERVERVRTADERRALLVNEGERIAAERNTLESGIATAELLVRAADRNQGKTAIHAPISGMLSETQLAERDGIGPHASLGVIEDVERLVLKVRVIDADWPAVSEGQSVTAEIAGRTVNGTVAWKVPRVGQEVRDQDWNLLVHVHDDVAGIEPGAKVEGAVVIGRRSLLRRLFDREPQDAQLVSVAGTHLAFVNDPTEQRSTGGVDEIAANEPVKGTGAAERAEAAGRN